MLTAAGRLSDKVAGFELGADDYLTKPFALEELIVRLHALARRPIAASPPVLEFADLRLDPFRQEAYRAGRHLKLTRKQFAVLQLLMQAGGGVVSAETMLEKAWDENADPFTSAPRVTMSTLRKALGSPDLIATVSGAGYRLVEATP
jgi:two-component system response regulator VanR